MPPNIFHAATAIPVPNCRPEVVNEQVFDLMFSLDATEEQLDYKTIYGSAKQGWMSHKWNEPTDSIVPLLDAIIDEIPEPKIVVGRYDGCHD